MGTKAVVDRFEEDKAVVLVGDDEAQLVVDRAQLPVGTREGDWLRVELRDGVLVGAEIDEAQTESMKERISEKLERLRRGNTS
jgi:hypothetical protein